MYHHILLPTDLSAAGHETAKKAWDIATQFDASLYMLHVIEPFPAYAMPGFVEPEPAYLEEAKRELMKWGNEFEVPESHLYIRVGQTKVEIEDLAQKLECDLIVMGSHGRHGISRILGSTAQSIVNASVCDVLLVQHKDG